MDGPDGGGNGEGGATRTADGRHIVVDGRKWRATDPSIPPPFERELVSELMSARRAVKHAADDGHRAAARARVNDAKIALGERGEPWWDEPTADGRRTRTAATIRALLRKRGEGKSICPSDVARTIGSPGWRSLLDEVREVARSLAADGQIVITKGATTIDPAERTTGPIRYRLPPSERDGD